MGTPTRKIDEHGQARLFYRYNSGLQNQAILYTRLEAQSHDQAQVLLDPNTLSTEGVVALKTTRLSPKGTHLAYQFAQGGSDWVDIKIRRVVDGMDLEDHLKWVKFSGLSWAKDESGFYYSRYDAPKEGETLTGVNYNQKLYFHTLNTPQDQDQLIYARGDQKQWGFDGEVSEDGRFLIISVWQGASEKNQIFYKRLDQENQPVIPLVDRFNYQYNFLGNEGDTLWFKTDRDAPKGQVISIHLNQVDPSQYTTLIPETEETLSSAQIINNRFVINTLRDASSRLYIYSLKGEKQKEIQLPGIGSTGGITGQRFDEVGYLSFTSFTQPRSIYQYDFKKDELISFFQPQLSIDTQEFKTTQVKVSSKDGTLIPVFIISAKETDLTQPHPTVLYGYGGFNISITPYFKPDLLVWLKRGGVYAVANLRGGGEYGDSWHKAGMKHKKQNVFDDFISAGEWLVKNNVTRPDLLGIHGGSNGGLLVGACANQRPDLFAAAAPAVGVMDMLRFHLFTIGWAWVAEYGSPDLKEDFNVLFSYSPVHTLPKSIHYPSTLVMTADHDDRVVPAHSFKYIAQLQAVQKGIHPTLIRIDTKAGHGAGTPTSKRIESATDLWTFFGYSLKMNTW
jgi:prolyl oligopeptidase